MLIDTGFGRGDVEKPRQLGRALHGLVRPQLKLEETAHAQVLARGFDPGDVHQHHHHPSRPRPLGRPARLPRGRRAPARRRAGGGAVARACASAAATSPLTGPHGPSWVEHEGGGEEWFGFQGVRILPDSDAEILLIPLAGHTLGHTGVAVRNGNGWLLHCGDAYFHHGEVETPPHCPPGLRFFQSLNQTDGAAAPRERGASARAGLAPRRRGHAALLTRRGHARSYGSRPGA